MIVLRVFLEFFWGRRLFGLSRESFAFIVISWVEGSSVWGGMGVWSGGDFFLVFRKRFLVLFWEVFESCFFMEVIFW